MNRRASAAAVLADATVLVVDDDPSNIALLERVLRDAGVSALHALSDAREVVARCLQLRPDIVLLDLHMPYMDGYEVLAALEAALPADAFLPVLVLTADASAVARKAALDAGAKDFLTKPFDHVETVQRVCNLLETGALYRSVRVHNAELEAELEARRDEEQRRASERVSRRERIERILKDGTLSMVFQPILELREGRLVGVEALARFDCEPRRPPNEWFADAAEVGLGPELELAAIDAAVRNLDSLPAHAFMSVNVSAAAALEAGLRGVLARVDGSRIVLELTEHARIDNYEPLLSALYLHRRHGVRIAVDDTGAGYAGMRHILRLRPDIIKLDLDLTRDIHTDPARRALAGSLKAFADEIGAVVVAEGIEVHRELVTLQNLAIPWGQGFYLGRPAALATAARDAARRNRARVSA